MKQLPLDLELPHPFAFDNFVVGANAELVFQLSELARGKLPERAIYIWGVTGTGKSHLLNATEQATRAGGFAVARIDAHSLVDANAPMAELLVVDDIEAASPASQIALFDLYNQQREAGLAWLAAGTLPPSQLPLREDLRNRMGWGLVYEVRPANDDDKIKLLQQRALERGVEIGEEVCRYLVTHRGRDLASLFADIAWLDREALAAKRPVTLPFAREALRQRR
ncbi:DnaA regulatory inactivator Hda [Parachitinimonas caeni]|uniref:DnaA regulatory inactivator Hda n=1 Tax=Parachitinimonas caeni TaxID=3031301 RepID=A0ABT7DST4_9NEIS|nr:DnaA regulatory inactivator Hda [Parachitinimonas caeni]MDK2123125.1 DnaA regulatory inactivator Hda [Parachitinimonas caeni]